MEFTDKCHQIENLTDEVGKFHPILQNIFPQLPNVKSFEYTHGQFERGADFVLEIENATTGRRSHIGVVVKCGKMSGGKVSEIEEQIKECAEERAYKVMKRVRCNEVWIFASGGYTERAKEKLLNCFQGRNLEFFGPEDIAKFVDDHYAYFWMDLPHDLGIYLQQLSSRLHILDRSTDLLASPDTVSTYIELDTYERITKTYFKNTRPKHNIKNIDFIHEALTTKLGLLEADMGSGKSKLARRLALSLCNADSYLKHKKVPIFATYKQFVDDHDANLESLAYSQLGIAAKCLNDNETELVIVLDGMDECSNAEHSSCDMFDKLADQVKHLPRYNVIFTSRPLKSLVDKAALYGGARIFGIRPLSMIKIFKYLEDTCKKTNLPARLFEDLKRSHLFKQIPQSPIAAALFSNLLAQGQQEVPQSLTELYSKSTELMLGRWEQKKELATEKQFKTAQTIAEQLATYFIENRLIYVAKNEIDQIVDDYLKKRNIGIDSNIIKALLFDRSNLFSNDLDTDTLAFRHRSFAEYLCASKKARDHSLSVKEAAFDPYWVNVFFFYTGTLLDCSEVLSEIRKTKAETEVEEWMKIISVPNYLLAAYQTEFEEVESNLMVVLLDTARLYLKVKSGNTETKLVQLTEMQLLYLLKSLITEALGYDFFNRGFDSLALRIEDALEEPEVKYYAMFFLGCAALECGNEAPFRFLIDQVGVNKLPLSISLAIRCELESSTNLDKSRLLKHQKNQLQKLLMPSDKKSKAGQIASQSHIRDLFEKPLITKQGNKPLNKELRSVLQYKK